MMKGAVSVLSSQSVAFRFGTVCKLSLSESSAFPSYFTTHLRTNFRFQLRVSGSPEGIWFGVDVADSCLLQGSYPVSRYLQ
jgi:hypothetical protein